MLELSGIAVDAVSVAGLETCIQLPGYGVAFDIGKCPRSAVNRQTVLFSHAHIDHLGGVVMHCATRSLLGMDPPRYAVPAENLAGFQDLLAAWRKLDGSTLPCDVVPISPGDSVRLGQDLTARAVRALHRVPTLGWVIWRTRRKLHPSLIGASQEEIRAARARGEPVSTSIEVPEVAFTGDSRIEVIEREQALRKATLLIMEVTFVDDSVSVQKARDNGHIHLDEVISRADMFENRSILFTHLSARYRTEQAREILHRRLPPSLRDRVTLLGHPPRPTGP